jgi:hypothetical protein
MLRKSNEKKLAQGVFLVLFIQVYSVSTFAAHLKPPKLSESYMNIHCATVQPLLAVQANVSINLNKIQKGKDITIRGDKADIQYWITLSHKQTISFKQIGINVQDNLVAYRGDDNGYFYALLIDNLSMLKSIGHDKFFISRILIGKLDSFGNPIGTEENRGSDAICYFNMTKNAYS